MVGVRKKNKGQITVQHFVVNILCFVTKKNIEKKKTTTTSKYVKESEEPFEETDLF